MLTNGNILKLICAEGVWAAVYLRETFRGLGECEEDVLTVFLASLPPDREEMKSLQAALQKQLDEANERAEKQQATVRLGRPDRQHPACSKQPSPVTQGLSVSRTHYPAASSLPSASHLIETLTYTGALLEPGASPTPSKCICLLLCCAKVTFRIRQTTAAAPLHSEILTSLLPCGYGCSWRRGCSKRCESLRSSKSN